MARAANGMVAVVRKQFDVPGVREGTVLPDYTQAVGISTEAAQRELLPVGITGRADPDRRRLPLEG